MHKGFLVLWFQFKKYVSFHWTWLVSFLTSHVLSFETQVFNLCHTRINLCNLGPIYKYSDPFYLVLLQKKKKRKEKTFWFTIYSLQIPFRIQIWKLQNLVLQDSLMGTRAAWFSRCSFIASFPFISGTGLCMRDMARVFLSLVPPYLFQSMLQCWYQSFHALCNCIWVAWHIDDLKQVPKIIRNYSTKYILLVVI